MTRPDIPAEFKASAAAQPLVCTLEAGDLLFVPAGSPHHVENLTGSIAVSGVTRSWIRVVAPARGAADRFPDLLTWGGCPASFPVAVL